MDKREYVPDFEMYKKTRDILSKNNEILTLVAMRMGCEMGLTRLEIVNSRISDIDRKNERGLWVEIAKKVKRGRSMLPRQRELPINTSLYELIKSYINNNDVYILHRSKGDYKKPFITRYINTLYEKNDIPWSSHKSRHFFKSQVWSYMMDNQKPDVALLKEYLGHKKDTTENYGLYAWDYKRKILDEVFK